MTNNTEYPNSRCSHRCHCLLSLRLRLHFSLAERDRWERDRALDEALVIFESVDVNNRINSDRRFLTGWRKLTCLC